MKKRSLLSLMRAHHWGLCVVLVAVAGLSGCGGGGSSGTPPSTTPPAPTTYLLGGTIQGEVLNLSGTTSILSGSSTKNPVNYNQPNGVATDGTYLYVADGGNNTVTQINIATGATATLTSSLFYGPAGITTEDGQTLFVANSYGNNILKVIMPANGDFANATVSVLAGDGAASEQDGTGSVSSGTTIAAEFNQPLGITTDGTNLYVSDYVGNTIRQVTIAKGVVTTLIPATDGLLSPAGITIIHGSAETNLFVADFGNNVIRKISLPANTLPTTMTILAGSRTTTTLDQPAGLTTDGTYLYVADAGNYGVSPDVKRIDMQGKITEIVTAGSNAASLLGLPVALTTDGKNIYIANALTGNVESSVIKIN